MKKIKEATSKFQKEVRKNVASAILAAFGFVIALVWRDAIQENVHKLIGVLGLTESMYLYKLIIALLVTVICVAGILFLSKWSEK